MCLWKMKKKKSHLPKVARHFDVFPCEEREKQLNQISESNELIQQRTPTLSTLLFLPLRATNFLWNNHISTDFQRLLFFSSQQCCRRPNIEFLMNFDTLAIACNLFKTGTLNHEQEKWKTLWWFLLLLFFGFYFIRSFAHFKRHFTSDIHDLI